MTHRAWCQPRGCSALSFPHWILGTACGAGGAGHVTHSSCRGETEACLVLTSFREGRSSFQGLSSEPCPSTVGRKAENRASSPTHRQSRALPHSRDPSAAFPGPGVNCTDRPLSTGRGALARPAGELQAGAPSLPGLPRLTNSLTSKFSSCCKRFYIVRWCL